MENESNGAAANSWLLGRLILSDPHHDYILRETEDGTGLIVNCWKTGDPATGTDMTIRQFTSDYGFMDVIRPLVNEWRREKNMTALQAAVANKTIYPPSYSSPSSLPAVTTSGQASAEPAPVVGRRSFVPTVFACGRSRVEA